MKFVRVSGPSSKLNKLINVCCAGGVFHPEPAGKFISESMGYIGINEESPYLKTIGAIKELADEFGFDIESGSKIKGAVVDESTTEYVRGLDATLERFSEENKNLTEQLEECNRALDKYNHFKGLNVDLGEIFNCRFVAVRFGHLPKDGYIKFIKGYGDNPYILFHPCSSDDRGYWGIYFAPRDKAEEIDRIFAALHFEKLSIPGAAGTTDEVIKNIKENIDIIGEQKAELEVRIRGVWEKEGDVLKALYQKLKYLQKVFELRSYAVHHGTNCFFVGWIPANYEKKFMERIRKYPEFMAEIEAPEKNGEITPPVMLKNSLVSRPFSYFVEMYGLPSYNDIDITAFVAFTYTILFGIMFGDIGQGLVLMLGGLLAWKLKGMALGKILVPCGFASCIFGFIFGSVFGFEHAMDPVYHSLGMKGKPLEVMDSINTVLLVAIGIGVVLVIVAMLINVLTNLKRKKFGSALFSNNGIAGICVYIAGANLAYGFMAGEPVFSSRVSTVMLLAGVLILFNQEILSALLDEGKLRKPESMTDYILQNLFECIEYILSYFSNTVSFLRVGAFVIVHASMMMVVFTLAGDTSTPKGIIVVILGNILVICLEGLLTGIQGLRLEFYEMFSRFYEGEGRPYIPVKLK